MGALLSEPITAMVVEECTCESWSASSASMQGWRKTHEDAHIFECSCGGPEPSGVFVVLDGHGGKVAADHSRDNLKALLVPLMQRGTLDKATAEEELRKAFVDTDAWLREKLPAEDKSGTTVVAALVTRTPSNYCIHLAHAGDSRVLVCGASGVIHASEDHKPSRQDETDRIRAAGGFVDHGPYGGGPLRVDGTLAVSRAFGDFHFKPSDRAPEACKVTPMPEVNTVYADPGDWILIACDGIFDVFSNEEARDFVSSRIPDGALADGSQVVQDLLKTCLDKGSKDNCTAMLIQLRSGCPLKPYERSLKLGEYKQVQNEEVLKKYREFFEAEGFADPAANSMNQ
jgi:serine/threonine protein phosphatase PrpC